MECRQCAVVCAENLIRIECRPPHKVVQRYALVRPTGGDGRESGWLIAIG